MELITLNVLTVTDNKQEYDNIRNTIYGIHRHIINLRRAISLDEAIKTINRIQIDVLLIDLETNHSLILDTGKGKHSFCDNPMESSDTDQLETFELMQKLDKVTVILLVDKVSNELAEAMINTSAQDYILKNEYTSETLLSTLQLAISKKKLINKTENNQIKYKMLFEQAGESIFIHNLEGKLLHVNTDACKRLGYTREELLSLTTSELNSSEYKQIVKTKMSQLEKKGEIVFETEFLTKDGNKIPLEMNSKFTEFNNQPAVISLAWDISERKRTESVLRETQNELEKNIALRTSELLKSNESLRNEILERKRVEKMQTDTLDFLTNILNDMTDAVVVLDKDRKIKDVNRKFLELYGGTKEEAIGRHCYEILHRNDSPCLENEYPCSFSIVFSKGQSFQTGNIHIGKNDNELFAEISAFPIFDNEANVTDVVAIIRDITERKEYERELEKAKEKAEEANRAKSSFLANMSHELRTPLNAIIGISQMMSLLDTGNFNMEQLQAIDVIHKSGQRLLGLINDILDLSKVEAGKMQIQLSPFSISKMLKSLEIIGNGLTRDKNVKVVIEQDLTPDIVISDEKKLNQILMNLLGNASKFTEEGKIIIRVYTIDDDLYFEVVDTGIGVSKEDLKYVFDEFRQFDSSLSKKYKGSGLGLAICKTYVKLLKGEIFAESELNKGSIIRFNIPLIINSDDIIKISNIFDKFDLKDEEPETENIVSKNFPVVLIAEDDNFSKTSYRIMLKSRYQVVFAENQADTIEKFKLYNPDVVVLDINSSQIDGLQTYKDIVKNDTAGITPIIAVTTYVPDKECENILSYGFREVIRKPINVQELFTVLDRFILS
ncbi:MAG: PAS domain S-box protein [Planctomycetes bacterium]|nr:PAS domain S-box protein [Planctomycetota bacterium]